MASETTSTSAAPAASPTVGQTVDAEITLLKARVASLETAAKTGWSDVVAWVKTNWPHIVELAALAYLVADKVGVLKLL